MITLEPVAVTPDKLFSLSVNRLVQYEHEFNERTQWRDYGTPARHAAITQLQKINRTWADVRLLASDILDASLVEPVRHHVIANRIEGINHLLHQINHHPFKIVLS